MAKRPVSNPKELRIIKERAQVVIRRALVMDEHIESRKESKY